ncbi:efflux RND transporter periplasmic adaptor subunit [bacterium]|nr:efflux RND transporter periplasmic adaptor subunit [bacterium]
MNYPAIRRVLLSALACAILLCLSACNPGPDVTAIAPREGTIRQSFSEPARTRLENLYPISMPVDGRIGRIELEPGDPVRKGDILVEFDRVPLELAVRESTAAVSELEARLNVQEDNSLEKTAMVETQATVDASKEMLKAADEETDAQRARHERAAKQLDRMKALADDQAISQSELDDAELEAETALISYRSEQFKRAAMNALMTAVESGPRYIRDWMSQKELRKIETTHRLEQARARLESAKHTLALAEIRSPIDGVVLQRHQQGDQAFAAGQVLLTLGNMDDLEVIADVLTQDAMKLEPEARVELTASGQKETIKGKVKRIEPAGFTKLSSLGVEQQRVNVIVSLEDASTNLGAGYRLQARFFTGQKDGALIVPRYSVLQAADGSYYVYRIVGGKLAQTTVEVGLRNDLEMEVVKGLSADDRIVETPDASMKDQQSVSVIAN